ncbi:hypothetical protein ACFQUU_06545 [Herbaspirillum sp. GCM10030257]|uniref:hypothetical protein n=1 Tax=Herbaspirillum sp. GCM10030257 TaxID=3273393 RepID=UPI0036224285
MDQCNPEKGKYNEIDAISGRMSRSKEVKMLAHMKHKKQMTNPRFATLLVFLAFGIVSAGTVAATGANANDIQARYQTESAACRQLPVAEERTACLREAAAARNEALNGQLSDAQETYERNALARCNALPVSDQEMCKRRTRGEGVVSGSVSEGGVYREYRQITMPDAVQIETVVVPSAPTSGQ